MGDELGLLFRRDFVHRLQFGRRGPAGVREAPAGEAAGLGIAGQGVKVDVGPPRSLRSAIDKSLFLTWFYRFCSLPGASMSDLCPK